MEKAMLNPLDYDLDNEDNVIFLTDCQNADDWEYACQISDDDLAGFIA